MARIRSIKPEFWTSEQVLGLNPVTRLLFIGMWNFCDDYGRMPFAPAGIKAKVMPLDPITPAEISEMIYELAGAGLILIYTAEGREYLVVTGWQEHQKIDKPHKPKYPAPFSEVTEQFAEPSPNTPRSVVEPSPLDRIGEERRGEEWKGEDNKRIDSVGVSVHAEFLKLVGSDHDDPSLFGSLYGIQGMLKRGFSRETILAGAANAMRGKARPPNWNYFAKCIESENDQRSAPAKKELAREKPENLVDTARRLAGSGVQLGPRPSLMGGGEDSNSVRLLPAGRGERPGDVHDGGGRDAGGISARGGDLRHRPEDGAATEIEIPAIRGGSP